MFPFFLLLPLIPHTRPPALAPLHSVPDPHPTLSLTLLPPPTRSPWLSTLAPCPRSGRWSASRSCWWSTRRCRGGEGGEGLHPVPRPSPTLLCAALKNRGSVCVCVPLMTSPRLPLAPLPPPPQANLQLVVSIGREYTDQLGSGKIVALLEAAACWPGMYLYLGGRLATSEVCVWGGGSRGQMSNIFVDRESTVSSRVSTPNPLHTCSYIIFPMPITPPSPHTHTHDPKEWNAKMSPPPSFLSGTRGALQVHRGGIAHRAGGTGTGGGVTRGCEGKPICSPISFPAVQI